MYDACRDINLTVEQFQGNRYIRLVQLRSLIDAGRLDGDLRWTTTAS
jgi:hypothetical protein